MLAIGMVAVCGSVGAADSTPAPATRPATTRAATLYEKLQGYPVMIGTFMKVEVSRFDNPAGEDVAVGYNFFRGLVDTSVVCTMYFYPLPDAGDPEALAKHRAAVLEEIASVHPKARVVSSGEAVVRQRGKEYSGLKVVLKDVGPFGAKGEERELRSELYLFRQGARVVKYRITYPAKEAADVAGRIETFLADFVWPER